MQLASVPSQPVGTSPTVVVGEAAAMDRLARGVILAGGVLVLAMLAWGHLGLGALLVPPTATAARQTEQSGAYLVTLRLDSGQLTARGPNAIALIIQDRAGHAMSDAQVHIVPSMTSMVMMAPTVAATGANGTYVAHPVFGMAGQWQLNVSIASPGRSAQHEVFAVGVHWS